jgi:hypothetical protein
MSFNLIQSVTSAQKYWPTTVQWVHDSLDQTSSKVDIDDRAKTILEQLKEHDSRTDKTRYQFGDPLTDREKLLKFIFNLSFKAQPDAITAAAETLHPEQTVFYPRWKKVCWIQIPTLAADVLNNVFVKIILSVIVLYKSGKACHASYAATPALIARSMPFIVNHTPLVLVRAANAVLDLKELAYGGIATILLFSYVGQQIILGLLPEIPHVTPLLRRLNIWSVISTLANSPQTIYSFVWDTAWNAAAFTWSNCTELANSIKGRASQANNERMAICKAKAFQVWQTIMIEQEPAY